MATIITERDVWHLDQQETEAKAERQGVKKMPGETLSKLLPLSFLPPFSPIYAYYAFARQSPRLTFHQSASGSWILKYALAYLTAHIMGLGGSSQGTAEPNMRMTPRRRSTPMVWLPLRVPSHILRKT